jgi:hypothetical protein
MPRASLPLLHIILASCVNPPLERDSATPKASTHLLLDFPDEFGVKIIWLQVLAALRFVPEVIYELSTDCFIF